MDYLTNIQLLGPVQVRAAGVVLAARGARQERLLAALALEMPGVVSMGRLIDVVWPAGPPPTARRQVQDLVSRLRGDLMSAGWPRTVVALHGPGYSLRLPAEAVDVFRFRDDVAEGRAIRARDPGQAAKLFRSALDWWRGDALAGFDCPALDADRIGLDELRLVTWEQAIEIELALGRYDELVGELATLTALHSTRERLVQLHMHALYGAGRTVDALGAYYRLRQRLADDLGIHPGPGLRRMHDSVVRGDLPLVDPVRQVAMTAHSCCSGLLA